MFSQTMSCRETGVIARTDVTCKKQPYPFEFCVAQAEGKIRRTAIHFPDKIQRGMPQQYFRQ